MMFYPKNHIKFFSCYAQPPPRKIQGSFKIFMLFFKLLSVTFSCENGYFDLIVPNRSTKEWGGGAVGNKKKMIKLNSPANIIMLHPAFFLQAKDPVNNI